MSKKHEKKQLPGYRLLNRDGTYNIERRRSNPFFTNDLYHSLLSSSWMMFLSYILGIFLLINIAFATVYFLIGSNAIDGMVFSTPGQRWLECFFFSVQTFATIGYGKLTPKSLGTNIVVTVEALVGMFAVALQTGLVFSRFSRPTAKVVFSNNAVISNIDGQLSLIIRIANARMNQIAEASAHVVLLKNEQTTEGQSFRNFYDLELERSNSPVFSLSWTIVHPITKTSPLFNMSLEKMAEAQVEIFISVTGIDETFAQPVHSRFSYIPKDILLDFRFADMIKRTSKGHLTLEIEKIHVVEPI